MSMTRPTIQQIGAKGMVIRKKIFSSLLFGFVLDIRMGTKMAQATTVTRYTTRII